jgi:hypothetical protein
MADAVYEKVVKETFEIKPLRTVLMIDDEFPTYADLVGGDPGNGEKKFRQKDKAIALYRSFQKRHMICDIENVAEDVRTDRIRKSDLVILDYHLGPADGDSERALKILRDLSVSSHFNTVVVYTAEPDLDKVWLDIVACLAGGWSKYPAALAGEASHHWDTLSDSDKLPSPSLDAVKEFARHGNVRDLSGPVREDLQNELTGLGVPASACSEIITAAIYVEMAKRAGEYKGEPYRPTVGGYSDGKRWVQSGNTFVTILKKEAVNDSDDPAGVMSCLSEALLAWRPNLIQILISEMQNILELEALATEDEHLRDPVTQTALWYYLLHSLGPIDPAENPDVKVPLMSIIDKIVDGVRRRLSSDSDLLKLASNALLGELRDAAWTMETWPKPRTKGLFPAAIKVARTDATKEDTLYRLNSFFSTEKFRRAHLTTGTIFYHAAKDQYFVAASPACDLVARRPNEIQSWSHKLHPMVPVVAVLLKPTDKHVIALNNAEQAEYIFLEGPEPGAKKTFKIVNDVGHPSYEFIFARNEGRTRQHEGKTIFDAARLGPKIVPVNGVGEALSPDEREFTLDAFEIVGQLRGMNATRILQMLGQHLSRIGLDFLRLPPDKDG